MQSVLGIEERDQGATESSCVGWAELRSLKKEKYLCHLKCRLSFQIKILIVKYVLYYKSTKILLISGVRS